MSDDTIPTQPHNEPVEPTITAARTRHAGHAAARRPLVQLSLDAARPLCNHTVESPVPPLGLRGPGRHAVGAGSRAAA